LVEALAENPFMIELTPFQHIELTQPQWLWLIPLLFFATLALRSAGKRQEASSLASGRLDHRHRFLHPLIFLLPGRLRRGKTPRTQVAAHGLALLCLVLALAEPVRIGERLPDPPQERDIIFIVDTSLSMILRDYVLNGERIDRITMLKGVLDRFIQQLPGERIGIIVFGDAAYTLVPLTRDQSLLRNMLSRIQVTMAGQYNDMGEAIALAVKQARQQQQGQRHRVLVLVTDADKPTGYIRPETASELAAEAGLPLYTVAIGATTEAAGEQRSGGLLYEPVDLALLQTIAENSGGKNYQAGDYQALERAIEDIARHETNPREVPPQYSRQALYLWPLMIGLILLVIPALGIPRLLQATAGSPQK
jgi:Ca-activated chloride channel family protein